MRIPPPASNPDEIVRFVDCCVWESASDFRRRKCEDDWDDAIQQLLGEQYPTSAPIDENGRLRFVINRIVRVVTSIMIIQAGDPPRIEFLPRESDEPPRFFLKQPGANRKVMGVEIPEQQAMVIQQDEMMQQQVAAQAAATGTPPPAAPQPQLIEVTDQTRCEALQTVRDAMAEKAGFQSAFRENVYYKIIFGVSPTAYDFDGETKEHIYDAAEVPHVFYQRNKMRWERNGYSIYDQYTSADEALSFAAMRMTAEDFAKVEDAINRFWKEGTPTVPGSQPYKRSEIYNQTFRRSGGFVRHAYYAKQPYPMTIKEALKSEKVLSCFINPDGTTTPIPQEIPQQSQPVPGIGGYPAAPAAGQGQGVPAVDPGMEQEGLDVSGGMLSAISEISDDGSGLASGYRETSDSRNEVHPDNSLIDAAATAETLAPDQLDEYRLPDSMPPGPPMTGYCLPSGQSVTPPDDKGNQTHPLWPMTLAVREIKIIGNVLVYDRRSRFNLLPIPNNVHIPIPYSPLGMGEVKILKDLQRAINRLFSDCLSWAAYNAVPPELILKAVADKMEGPLKRARSKWGQRIVVPQDLIPDGWKMADVISNPEVPPLPADLWKLLNFLIDMMDKEGNQAEVAEGNAAPGWSGEAISALQNAHNQLIRATALNTEDWIRHIVRLEVNSITHLMTPEDCYKICRKYPIEVWKVLHDGFPDLDPYISIKIGSASGAAEDAQTTKIIGAAQAGVIQIPQKMMAKRLGLNPDEIEQGNAEQQANQPAPVQGQNPKEQRNGAKTDSSKAQ